MKRGGEGRKLVIVALVLLLAGAAEARTQSEDPAAPIPPLDPMIKLFVDQLEDPSFDTRETASRRLLETPLERSTLLDLVRRADLSSEQRHRILWIFRQRLFETPRGAVGIRMDQNLRGDQLGPVRIAELIPGLPAEHVLDVGDRITHVNGRRITSPQQLILEVQMKAPGDTVQLTVERPRLDETGREVRDAERQVVTDTIEIDLALGSADLLIDDRTGQPQRGGPVDRRRAEEANEVVKRFGPEAKVLTIRGASELVSLDEPDDLDVLAERHIAVRTILAERRAVDDGRLTLSPQLQDRWQRQLDELREELQKPGLSDLEREYMRRVVERYRGLAEEG